MTGVMGAPQLSSRSTSVMTLDACHESRTVVMELAKVNKYDRTNIVNDIKQYYNRSIDELDQYYNRHTINNANC